MIPSFTYCFFCSISLRVQNAATEGLERQFAPNYKCYFGIEGRNKVTVDVFSRFFDTLMIKVGKFYLHTHAREILAFKGKKNVTNVLRVVDGVNVSYFLGPHQHP